MYRYITSDTNGKYIDIQNDVIARYRIVIDPYSSCWARTHAHIRERRICKWKQKNSIASTLELFHEIGHIETTKSNMRRCESEYYATQWALDRCAEYGLDVPDKLIQSYQDYIDDELARGQRRHGSGYDEGSLKLHK